MAQENRRALLYALLSVFFPLFSVGLLEYKFSTLENVGSIGLAIGFLVRDLAIRIPLTIGLGTALGIILGKRGFRLAKNKVIRAIDLENLRR